jgi:CheY-like chemotaxis protein
MQLDLTPGLPRMLMDTDKVQHAVLNLVGNALHALCDRPSPRRIVVQTRTVHDEIHLSVTDNGPGVPPDLVPRIFEPFFTTKEVGTGTGLGLSVVHSIMADHCGRVFHEAPPEGGARFVLVFPVTETGGGTAAPTHAASQADESVMRGARVLVLDDEPAIAELLREMLNLLGCETRVANAGAQALEFIREGDFDVILSDFRMPNMNGQQFYEQVRLSRPALADRIIFLTGDVVNEQTQSFLQSCGNPHLAKPFNLTTIQAAIIALLREKARAAA